MEWMLCKQKIYKNGAVNAKTKAKGVLEHGGLSQCQNHTSINLLKLNNFCYTSLAN